LALVRPGAPIPFRCCSPILNREEWQYGTDEQTQRDLLLLLPVEATRHISNLHIHVAGENGLEATADVQAVAEAERHLETHIYLNDSGPADASGHRVVNGFVVRIPVRLDPTKPWDIGGNRYPLAVTATYDLPGETQRYTFSSRGAIDAGVPGAAYEMALASFILPLICLGVAFRRWRRTR
jgi:hypothetical protein